LKERRKLSEDALRRVEGILQEMRDENMIAPVLVEGRRDEEALRKLDFQGEIILINSGISLPDLSQRIAKRYGKVMLLTDWDRKGSYLAGKLYTLLRDLGVSVNMEYRRLLKFYTGSEISTVEELPGIF